MTITRQRDNFHWTCNSLLSYNKTFNFAVSGRGPGKTTDTVRYMMNQHKRGYMTVLIKRNLMELNDTTITDFQNAYNVLMPDDEKIELTYKHGDLGAGKADIYIENDPEPFFRIVALNNKLTRLKGMAFDREISLVVFDEYKISGTEKYLKDEYARFQEFYATLCRFGIQQPDGSIKPPRVLFLGNNYSLTDPYMANMRIPIKDIAPGKIITGADWAFEDIKINDQLREYLLKQNPLFNFGDDAYNKYALEGISVSDQRIQTIEKQPDNFKLAFVFYIESKYLGIYFNNDRKDDEPWFWVSVLDKYDSKRRDIACFDYTSLIDGTYLLSRIERSRFAGLQNAFRFREVAFKSIYEGYLFEQIYDLL